MFDSSSKPMDCTRCSVALEDCLHDGAALIDPDSPLAGHLQDCEECREALENALLASKLMGCARETVPQASDAFVTRVMARICEMAEREPLANAIWRPLELLASRFALIAAVVLLALSVYLAEFAPSRPAIFTTSQTEVGAGMPEPPAAPPSNQDDVLMSLVERSNGN
jgi:predicted anti-sigma-YlaC factor YlaD